MLRLTVSPASFLVGQRWTNNPAEIWLRPTGKRFQLEKMSLKSRASIRKVCVIHRESTLQRTALMFIWVTPKPWFATFWALREGQVGSRGIRPLQSVRKLFCNVLPWFEPEVLTYWVKDNSKNTGNNFSDNFLASCGRIWTKFGENQSETLPDLPIHPQTFKFHRKTLKQTQKKQNNSRNFADFFIR